MKFSILLPVRNGQDYISNAIETVLSTRYEDFELVISDNFSNDDTSIILSKVIHEKCRIIKPKTPLSMAEHWEFIINAGQGDWLLILGVDDGLFPYTFELLDDLVDKAASNNLKVIMSSRAYYFWPGCESVYGNLNFHFDSADRVVTKNILKNTFKALIGEDSFLYFDLPQMYSNSVFHRSLFSGYNRIFSSITPDANLAIIAFDQINEYLYSSIPLGWIGTSLNSNGFSHYKKLRTSGSILTSNDIAEDFVSLNSKSKINFHSSLGNPMLSKTPLLLYEAGVQHTFRHKLRSLLWNSKIALILVLAKEMRMANNDQIFVDNLNLVAKQNDINQRLISIANLNYRIFTYLQNRFIKLIFLKITRILQVVVGFKTKSVKYYQLRATGQEWKSMVAVNKEILNNIDRILP